MTVDGLLKREKFLFAPQFFEHFVEGGTLEMVGLKQPVQGLAEGDQAEDLLDQVEAVGPTALFHKDITV